MNLPITAHQIRAARTYLDWSQDQLAEATGLGKTTIKSLEAGHISIQSAFKVRKAFESYGLEFTDGDGVRRRAEGVRVLKSPHSCDEFFEDMLDTVRESAGEILVMARSPEYFLRSCGVSDLSNLKQLELLGEETEIKCLLVDAEPPDLHLPMVEFRTVPPSVSLGARNYFVYGNKLVLVCPKGHAADFNFVILDALGFADAWRFDFLALWDLASSAPARKTEKFSVPSSVKNLNVKYLDLDVSNRRSTAD